MIIKKRTIKAMVRWRARYEIPENSGLYNQLTSVIVKIEDVGKLHKAANKGFYKARQEMIDAVILSRSNDPTLIRDYDTLHDKLCETEALSVGLCHRICELWAQAEGLAKQIEDVEQRAYDERSHMRQRMQKVASGG